jgi:pyruvate/2-oxoglutarate dehydrogenase complex dihydrolipoamide acyltransferase (E2) component
MTTIEVRVPDIGNYQGVPVIEILVAPGDRVEADTSLITLESDKASMDVPSPLAGTVQGIEVKIGDKVSQGDLILLLAASGTEAAKRQLPDTLSAVALGPRAVGWKLSSVIEWIDALATKPARAA